MERSGRRIFLAVEPAVLEGALAQMLTASRHDDVVSGAGGAGDYEAAVVSGHLPVGVRAGVVITLPDTRGSGGTGTLQCGDLVQPVDIDGAHRVVELLDEHLSTR
jgi:hypothetical protein